MSSGEARGLEGDQVAAKTITIADKNNPSNYQFKVTLLFGAINLNLKADTGILVSSDRVAIEGLGPQQTIFWFQHDRGGVAVKFDAMPHPLVQNRIKGIAFNAICPDSIKPPSCLLNASYKTALQVWDVRNFIADDITVYGYRTKWDVGLNTHGRDMSTFSHLSIAADIPIQISSNPNFPSSSTEDADHFHFQDVDLSSSGFANIFVDDGVSLTAFTLDGYQSWNFGTYGFYYNNTKTVYASHNIRISNARWEQTPRTDGYLIYLASSNAQLQNVLLENIYGGSRTDGKGTGGIYLRGVTQNATIMNYEYVGSPLDKYAINTDSSVPSLVLINNWWYPQVRTSTSGTKVVNLNSNGDYAFGDFTSTGPGNGMILRTPDGLKCYKMTVDNNGSLVSTPTTCQ